MIIYIYFGYLINNSFLYINKICKNISIRKKKNVLNPNQKNN